MRNTLPSPMLQKGKLVFIRDLCAEDQRELTTKAKRDTAFHQPWVSPPLTAESFKVRLANGLPETHRKIAVCLKSSNELVGVVNISEIVRGALQGGYLGYYGFSDFSGQGFMTEGLKLVAKYAFTVLKLHRLEANIQPKNLASIALVQRCGFSSEGYSPRYLKIRGRWCDHERWALLKEDFRTNA